MCIFFVAHLKKKEKKTIIYFDELFDLHNVFNPRMLKLISVISKHRSDVTTKLGHLLSKFLLIKNRNNSIN